jgi:hydroxylaminobenzene mutase
VKRRLLWHGIFIALLGLVAGAAVPAFTNPRMGLSAHLGGVMTGTLVAVIGALWDQLRLPARVAAGLFWITLYAGYANFGALVLAAIFGTSRMTPMAGAGHTAAAWQEGIVDFGLTTGALAIIATCLVVLWGLRGPPAGAPPPGA